MKKLGTILLVPTFLALAILAAPAPSLSATLASTATSLCAANSSAAALPSFLSPVLSKSPGPIQWRACGACSYPNCVGRTEFQQCGTDAYGRIYSCSETGGGVTCPADGLLQCVCVLYPA